ncbi:MAG: ABC transporter transmembrane domain-containing protein [Owenweeksia sp.]|nr:ABC transporter transmembrane domain-containing protein [Owenweeksia sp.]
MFRDPLMILGSLIILLMMSPQLTDFVFILLPVVSIVITSIGKSLKRTSTKAQQAMGGIMAQTEENLTALKVIKAFNAEGLKNSLFQKTADRYFQVMNRVLRKSDLASPLSEFMGASVFAIIIWYGVVWCLLMAALRPKNLSPISCSFTRLSPLLNPCLRYRTKYNVPMLRANE